MKTFSKENRRRNIFVLAILAAATLALCSACHRMTPDEVAAVVLDGELKNAPLLVQQMVMVDNITMDSVSIRVPDFPMEGLLYTTWTAGGRETPVIVQVNNIHKSKEHNGYIEWETDWESAAKAFLLRQLL